MPSLPEQNPNAGSAPSRRDYMWLAAAVLALGLQGWYLWDFSIDDVFISFRYAAQLAAGHGLTWNAGGPPVEGFSNFLWVIILGVAGWLGAGIESASKCLGLLLGAVNLGLTYVLCLRTWRGVSYWWLPVVLVAVTPAWVLWVMSGLEIALFGAFVLVAIVALTETPQRRRWLLLAAAVGLPLVRPEGAALAAIPIGIGFVMDRDRSSAQRLQIYGPAILGGVIATLGLMGFRLAYFGYPFPNTVYAKGTTHLASLPQVADWLRFGAPFLIAWAAALGLAGRWRHPAAVWSAIGIVVAQILIVLPVNPVMYLMHRYQIALLPLLVLALPYMLHRLAQYRRWLPIPVVAGVIFWCAWSWPEANGLLLGARQMAAVHRDVAAYLDSLPNDPVIALCDAGRIPFWSGRRTLDVAGLCDVEWAHHGFSAASLLDRNPDVYVISARPGENELRPVVGRDNLVVQEPAFRQRYGFSRIFVVADSLRVGTYGYGVLLNVAWAHTQGLDVSPMQPASR